MELDQEAKLVKDLALNRSLLGTDSSPLSRTIQPKVPLTLPLNRLGNHSFAMNVTLPLPGVAANPRRGIVSGVGIPASESSMYSLEQAKMEASRHTRHVPVLTKLVKLNKDWTMEVKEYKIGTTIGRFVNNDNMYLHNRKVYVRTYLPNSEVTASTSYEYRSDSESDDDLKDNDEDEDDEEDEDEPSSKRSRSTKRARKSSKKRKSLSQPISTSEAIRRVEDIEKGEEDIEMNIMNTRWDRPVIKL